MADTDNLDNLSNAELRAQMKAHGLPNIPVTDSSRKVLVKRLRASLSGNAASPAATGNPKKPVARRETLMPAFAAVATQPDKSDAAKSRRTIAVPSSDSRGDEGRRQPEIKKTVPEPPAANNAPMPAASSNLKKPTSRRESLQPATSRQADKPDGFQATSKSEQTSAVQPSERPVAVVTTTAVPIQSRRMSNSEQTRREQVPERIVRKPEPIAEEPQAEKSLPVNSLIVLESDDEEDEEMAKAAQKAEDLYSHRRDVVNPKLTTTTVNTHEYVTKPLYPSLEEHRPRQQYYEPLQRLNLPRTVLGGSAMTPATTASTTNTASGGYDYLAATGRYSSIISSPINSCRGPSSITNSGTFDNARLRRTPARTEFSTEFSDDDDRPEPIQFESAFANSLARLRSERIGDRSSPYRRTIGGGSTLGSISGGRRSLRQEQPSPLRNYLEHLWLNLDQKYSIKSKLFILLVVLVLYGVYCFFY